MALPAIRPLKHSGSMLVPRHRHRQGRLFGGLQYHDCDLMEALWKKSPGVPVILSAPKTGARVALDSVVEVRKAQRIAEKEDWSMVSDDVPISVLSVELESKPADIALRIGSPAFPSDGRKACEHRQLLCNLRTNRRLSVLGDVVGRPKRSMRAPVRVTC